MLVYVCICMYCYTQKGFICNKDYKHLGGVAVVIVWYLDLQLPVQPLTL